MLTQKAQRNSVTSERFQTFPPDRSSNVLAAFISACGLPAAVPLAGLHPSTEAISGGGKHRAQIEISFSRDGRAGMRLIRITTVSSRSHLSGARRRIVRTVSSTGETALTR